LLKLSSLKIDKIAHLVQGHLLDQVEEENGCMDTTIETCLILLTAILWGTMLEGDEIASLNSKKVTNELDILGNEEMSESISRGVASQDIQREGYQEVVHKLPNMVQYWVTVV
jgi:hypothetical protein